MEYRDETALNIYTDGCSLQRPRRGGVGIVFLDIDDEGREHAHEHFLPGYRDATNNEMELKAPILALLELEQGRAPVDPSRFRKIVIWTDSQYLTENIDNAIYRWPRADWLGPNGAPILNAELWQELTQHMRRTRKRVEFKWVKGHKHSPYNKLADRLAKASAREAFQTPLAPKSPGRKLSRNPTTPGAVQMSGQIMVIRVIEVQVLRKQNLNRYRYEVMSPDSPFVGCVDWIVAGADTVLRRQHSYLVQVNEESANPRIAAVIEEA